MSSSAATLAGNVGAAARPHKERVLVSHSRRARARATSAFRSGPLSGWGARRERAYRELRAVLRGGGGGRAFIQGVEEERSESVEYRSLESVISCGVQSVCVASGACVRSVKRFLNGRCTTYYIGSGPERMFMLLRVLSRSKTVTDNAASLLAMVSSCTPETGGLASHCGHCPSQRRNSHSGSAPPAHGIAIL
jgi:hypothetical protein